MSVFIGTIRIAHNKNNMIPTSVFLSSSSSYNTPAKTAGGGSDRGETPGLWTSGGARAQSSNGVVPEFTGRDGNSYDFGGTVGRYSTLFLRNSRQGRIAIRIAFLFVESIPIFTIHSLILSSGALTGTPTRTYKHRPQRSLRAYTQLIFHSPRSIGQCGFLRFTFVSY
jgi:hypothetical protein